MRNKKDKEGGPTKIASPEDKLKPTRVTRVSTLLKERGIGL